jgi:hypothetical protein
LILPSNGGGIVRTIEESVDSDEERLEDGRLARVSVNYILARHCNCLYASR